MVESNYVRGVREGSENKADQLLKALMMDVFDGRESVPREREMKKREPRVNVVFKYPSDEADSSKGYTIVGKHKRYYAAESRSRSIASQY